MGESTQIPWHPSLFPKQMEVFNSRKRFILASGPRMCSKTTGVLHKLLRHAWEVKGARIAMFSKTQRNAKAAGVWTEITGHIIQEWFDANLVSPSGSEFRYTVPPKVDGATRMHHFKIQNYWGTESEIQLHSLDYDGDIEDKMLETSFSAIYFSELQKFESPDIFRISIAQLRMSEIAYEDHFWISDTNPPESGPNHFAYDLFFVQPGRKDHSDPAWQQKFHLIKFDLRDNLSKKAQQDIADLKKAYFGDVEATERFINGSWLHSAGHGSKHFSALFNRNTHVFGEASLEVDKSEWEFLNPSEGCYFLRAGWDLGHTNHAFQIIERTVNEHGKSVWNILDELVSVNERVTIEEFGYACIEKIEALEKVVGKRVEWNHWSDTSAFRFNAGGTDAMDSTTIERISEGRIQFLSARAAKGPGSVRKRVELVRKLLREGRLRVSAHCFFTIKMFEQLRKGHTELEYVVRSDDNKHPFDSLSYAIYSEMLMDLEELPETARTGRRNDHSIDL